MRAAIHSAFDNDTLMLQWMGHGSAVNWDGTSFHNVFDTDGYGGYLPLLPNEQYPLTVAYACNSSYFIFRQGFYNLYYNSLAESMVRGVDRGSVADIGPTGQHVVSAITTMNKQIASNIFVDRQPRVGLALDAAKDNYVSATTAFHDMLHTTILLGDPATKLKLPAMPRLVDSTISLGNDGVTPGRTGEYSVSVVNNGDAPADQVVVQVDYDQSKMTVINTGGATNNGDVLTWNLGTVPVGNVRLTFIVQFGAGLPAGSSVSTTGTVVATGQLPVPLLHSATVITPATPTPTNTTTATSVPPTATNTATATLVPPTATPTTTATATATATNTATPAATPTNTATATPTTVTTLDYIWLPVIGNNSSLEVGSWTLREDGTFGDTQGRTGRWRVDVALQRLLLAYNPGHACSALLVGNFVQPGVVQGRSLCRDGSGAFGVWKAQVRAP